MVAYNNKKYYIDIVETKPSNAISIIETDCEVDFAPPLDYKEPEPVKPAGPANMEPATGTALVLYITGRDYSSSCLLSCNL
jgi:ubiquitin fusion degradation protein 1